MTPKLITLHYSATRPEWMRGLGVAAKIAEINRWHLDRGWNGIGYHYVIDRDGSIGKGRPDNVQGAHTGGHNKDNLGICLLGGHGATAEGEFDDWFTPQQREAVIKLVGDLQDLYKIPDSAVKGHNNYNATSCPGCDIPTWWAAVNKTHPKPRTTPKFNLGEFIMNLLASIFGR